MAIRNGSGDGGDTATACKKYNAVEEVSHCSTGGRAPFGLLDHKAVPCVATLDDKPSAAPASGNPAGIGTKGSVHVRRQVPRTATKDPDEYACSRDLSIRRRSGDGDTTATACMKYDAVDEVSHCSACGGASRGLLVDKVLPGVATRDDETGTVPASGRPAGIGTNGSGRVGWQMTHIATEDP